MKSLFLMILVYTFVFMSSRSSCNKEDDNKYENKSTMANGKFKITINSKTFTAMLLDTDSAKALKEMLPMTIRMTELNGNEKYYDWLINFQPNPQILEPYIMVI